MSKTSVATFLAASILLIAACGGKQHAAPATAAAAPEAAGHGGHGDHHPELPPALHAFHELLAPLWHAAEGDERTQKTCDAVADFRIKAAAVENGTEVVAAVEMLAGACGVAARPEFQAKFGALHDAFHAAMERVGKGHDDHGDKGGHGDHSDHGDHGDHGGKGDHAGH